MDGQSTNILPKKDEPVSITLNSNKYVVGELLGGGAEGLVFRASSDVNQELVIKELKGGNSAILGERDPEISNKRRQLELLVNLNGITGIPVIHDHGIGAFGHYYVVMDYVVGDTLEDCVTKRKRYDVNEAKDILQQLLLILQKCHSKGIYHRDVKPVNIKYDQGRVTLIDFGTIADAMQETRTLAVGTLGYVSPEQRNDETITPASDIYSAGKTLYRLLTERKISATQELKHVDFEPLSSVYGTGFSHILEKMCEPNRERRYQNAKEVLEDLVKGDVTENTEKSYALQRNGQERKVKTLERVWERVWDWLRYKTIYVAGAGGINTVLEKRFGDGPQLLVLDANDNPIYGCLEHSPTGVEFRIPAILNKQTYFEFLLPDGFCALISKEGQIFGEKYKGSIFGHENYTRAVIKEGQATDYILVLERENNAIYHQYLGKDGFIGARVHVFNDMLHMINADGWTERKLKDQQHLLISPTGASFDLFDSDMINGNITIDKLLHPLIETPNATYKIKIACPDGTYFGQRALFAAPRASAVHYDPVDNQAYVYVKHSLDANALIRKDGQFFANKVSVQDTASLTLVGNKIYLVESKEHYERENVTYTASDGTLLGLEENWRKVILFKDQAFMQQEKQASSAQYAICIDNNYLCHVFDENNIPRFHTENKRAYSWHASDGGLDVLCGIETTDYGSRTTIRNAAGKVLYFFDADYEFREDEKGQEYIHIDVHTFRAAAVIGDKVIRMINRYLHKRGNADIKQELRDQTGKKYFDSRINNGRSIEQFSVLEENKLLVKYNDGTRSIVPI